MSWLKSKLSNCILSPECALEVSAKHVTSLHFLLPSFFHVCPSISCTHPYDLTHSAGRGRFSSSPTLKSFDERSCCIFRPHMSSKGILLGLFPYWQQYHICSIAHFINTLSQWQQYHECAKPLISTAHLFILPYLTEMLNRLRTCPLFVFSMGFKGKVWHHSHSLNYSKGL